MAYPVYSFRFVGGESTSSSLFYTVPAGYVASVKHADCVNVSGAAVTAIWLGLDADGNALGGWREAVENDTSATWDGMLVLNAGEQVQAIVLGTAFIQVSGFLFST